MTPSRSWRCSFICLGVTATTAATLTDTTPEGTKAEGAKVGGVEVDDRPRPSLPRNRPFWLVLIWAVGSGMIFWLTHRAPASAFQDITSPSTFTSPVALRWFDGNRLIFVEQDGGGQRVKSLTVEESSTPQVKDMPVPGVTDARPLAFTVTKSTGYAAAVSTQGPRLQLVVWSLDRADTAATVPLSVPSGAHAHALLWARDFPSGDPFAPGRLLLFYDFPEGASQEHPGVLPITVAFSRKDFKLTLTPGPPVTPSMTSARIWKESPVPSGSEPQRFLAAVADAPQSPGATDAPDLHFYLFEGYQDQFLQSPKNIASDQPSDQSKKLLTLKSLTWSLAKDAIFFGDSTPKPKPDRLKPYYQDMYEAYLPPTKDRLSQIQGALRLNRVQRATDYADRCFGPRCFTFAGHEYMAFADEMQKSGTNLWVKPLQGGKAHQITTHLDIVAAPVIAQSEGRVCFAVVSKEPRDQTGAVHYRIHVFVLDDEAFRDFMKIE